MTTTMIYRKNPKPVNPSFSVCLGISVFSVSRFALVTRFTSVYIGLLFRQFLSTTDIYIVLDALSITIGRKEE